MSFTPTKTGDRFKVITPTFPTTYGQGEPPSGFTLINSEGTLFLPWSQSFEADCGLTEMSAEIGGTLYVRCDIVDELAQGEHPVVRCTKRAPTPEPIPDPTPEP